MLQIENENLVPHPTRSFTPKNPKIQKPTENKKLSPSLYMKINVMNTEERLNATKTMYYPKIIELLDMSETSWQRFSSVPIGVPLLQPFPSEIFFQRYQPNETYKIPLTLRNNDKVPRLIKITQIESPYFKIISPNDANHKVGPGLPITFKILFTPEENKDYVHELICITEREKFVIPVRGIGARPILDFPDQIEFNDSLVNYVTKKEIFVRNIGDKEAQFSLSTKSPFTVSPTTGIVPLGGNIQITIAFNPTKCQNYNEDLILHYGTGEELYIHLTGNAQNGNIFFKETSIYIDKTFITLTNEYSLKIVNNTNVIAHFYWSPYESALQEEIVKTNLCDTISDKEFADYENLKKGLDKNLIQEELTLFKKRNSNRRKSIIEQKLLFEDKNFQLFPVEGDVWPYSETEIILTFYPDEAIKYRKILFCCIEGLQNRIPIEVIGVGIGPKICLSFDSLDVGNVFINSKHSFEIVLANRTDIPARFSILPPVDEKGKKFILTPDSGEVAEDSYQAVQILFSAERIMTFSDRFQVKIHGVHESLHFEITGSVIGPTFRFDKKSLNFGNVAFGFPSTMECTLINTALIPMNFQLFVKNNGITDPITAESDDSFEKINKLAEIPSDERQIREFSVFPDHGQLAPKEKCKIKIEILPNQLCYYENFIVMDVKEIGENIFQLPFFADCSEPNVSLLGEEIHFGRCFLRYSSFGSFEIINNSNFPTAYRLRDQIIDENTKILYKISNPRGNIMPNSTMVVTLEIYPQEIGYLENDIFFDFLECPVQTLKARILCFCEGPVVHVSPPFINFGNIRVLRETSKLLFLSNQSPIPAIFTIAYRKKGGQFSSSITSGVIQPEESAQVKIIAFLRDTLLYKDKIYVYIENTDPKIVLLSAHGYGTTISVDPPFCPSMFLGNHFSTKPFKNVYKLKNEGKRQQHLVWNCVPMSSVTNKNGKIQLTHEIATKKFKTTFTLNPNRMDLNVGDECLLYLEAKCQNPQKISELIVCDAIIGQHGGKDTIISSEISCNFIEPNVEFENSELTFVFEKNITNDLHVQNRSFGIRNVCPLKLETILSTEYPFSLAYNSSAFCQEMTLIIDPDVEETILVQFDPAFEDDLINRQVVRNLVIKYVDHVKIDRITLKGQVFFPNLTFDSKFINFGNIINNKQSIKYLRMYNSSTISSSYSWNFVRNTLKTEIVIPEESPPDSENPPIEQIFDILPSNGVVNPQESEIIAFTYFGNENRAFTGKACCYIQGGPIYEFDLQVVSSEISYHFEEEQVNLGKILFDRTCLSKISVYNDCVVPLKYIIVQDAENKLIQPSVEVQSGTIEGNSHMSIQVEILPLILGDFERYIKIQIAHFEPKVITFRGYGVCPSVDIDLMEEFDVSDSTAMNDKLREFVESNKSLNCAGLDERSHLQFLCKRLFEKEVPIDFGNVIPGIPKEIVFSVRNICEIPISFKMKKKCIKLGFKVIYNEMEASYLPVGGRQSVKISLKAPQIENESLSVFSQQQILIENGPSLTLNLMATVTKPFLTFTSDVVEFDSVQTSFTKVIFVRLNNPHPVDVHWSIKYPLKKKKQIDKFLPLHLKVSKNKEKDHRRIFDFKEINGTVFSGEFTDLPIAFSPREEIFYDETIIFNIVGNQESTCLQCTGYGHEPKLQFDLNFLEFGPCLPHSSVLSKEVKISNPCDFDIEFYSLNFDKKYVSEDQILKNIACYDEFNCIMIPARYPRTDLPKYLTETVSSSSPTKIELADDFRNDSENQLSDNPISEKNKEEEENFIAFLIFESPEFDKSKIVEKLTEKYKIKHLVVDQVITEEISSDRITESHEICRKLCREAYAKREEGLLDVVERTSEVFIDAPTPSKMGVSKTKAKEKNKSMVNEGVFQCGVLKTVEIKPGMISCTLPEDTVVELISERIQSECMNGVVISGFESVYTPSYVSSLTCALKSLGNQKHIYSIFIKSKLSTYIENKRKHEEEIAKMMELKELEERQLIEEMSESEYENLSQTEKEAVNVKLLEIKRERMEKSDKEKQEKLLKEQIEKESSSKKIEERRRDRGKNKSAGGVKEKLKTFKSREDVPEQSDSEKKKLKKMNDSEKKERGGVNSDGEDTLSLHEMSVSLRYKIYDGVISQLKDYLTYWNRHNLSSNSFTNENEDDIKSKQKGAREPKKQKIDLDEKNKAKKDTGVLFTVIEPDGMEDDQVIESILSCEAFPSYEMIFNIFERKESLNPPQSQLFSMIKFPNEQKNLVCFENFSIISVRPEETEVSPVEELEIPVPKANLSEKMLNVSPPKSKKMKNQKRKLSEKKDRNLSLSTSQNEAEPPLSDQEVVEVKPKEKYYRWVVPANQDITMNVGFMSDIVGNFDQTLSFEILGSRRLIQLFCRGICCIPAVCADPKFIFNSFKKRIKDNEIFNNKFILETNAYHFGPLLVGKSREKYREYIYVENSEKLSIKNISYMNIEIEFSFLNDENASIFLFDPHKMTLEQNETKILSIWAYPTKAELFEDTLIFSIKNNPIPLTFDVCCCGVKPELKFNTKILQFDKVLLHRKESKTINIYNPTQLPVGWRLAGMENLGDDFSVLKNTGIVMPYEEFSLPFFFRTTKPVIITKKYIRFEIFDASNIVGIVDSEIINVAVEAYDIALDITFPKGVDGGLDFGVFHVGEEVKQNITLKNKGKYEIAYNFMFYDDDKSNGYKKYFNVTPKSNTLGTGERPNQIHLNLKTDREIDIKNLPILKFQVIDMNVSNKLNVIANIPVRVSAKSVYSRFQIVPANEINFGHLSTYSKKSRTLTIENTGNYEFKYYFIKSSDKKQKSDLTQPNLIQTRISVNCFTISPACGLVMPGNIQIVNIDCVTENPSVCTENFYIEISDRDTTKYPKGIPLKLMTETVQPEICTNIDSVFEEQLIVEKLQKHDLNQLNYNGIFIEDEQKLLFPHVSVGKHVQCRIKLRNISQISVDIIAVLKSPGKKQLECFSLEVSKFQIPINDYVMIPIKFLPTNLQMYNTTLECYIDNNPGNPKSTKTLIFSYLLEGEGIFPSVQIIEPKLKNLKGQPVILFERTRVNKQIVKPLEILNSGVWPSVVSINLKDSNGAFKMGNSDDPNNYDIFDFERSALTRRLNANERFAGDIIIESSVPNSYKAQILITVDGNEYEETIIPVQAEIHDDPVILEGLQLSKSLTTKTESSSADEFQIAILNHIHLPDVVVGNRTSAQFSLVNCTENNCYRFTWNEIQNLKIHPKIGHLHAGTSKNMTVAFKTSKPVQLSEQIISCKLQRITFTDKVSSVIDWDDQLKAAKWDKIPQYNEDKSEIISYKNSKIYENVPEIEFTEVNEALSHLDLKVSAKSDTIRYSLDVSKLTFSDIPVLESDTKEICLTNESTIGLEYFWEIEEISDSDSNSEMCGEYRPLSIYPQSGAVQHGKVQTFTVKFTPLEVNKIEIRMQCRISDVSDKSWPIVSIAASSKSPNFYFDLEKDSTISNFQYLYSPLPVSEFSCNSFCSPVRIKIDTNAVQNKIIKKFVFFNPIDERLRFQWVNKDEFILNKDVSLQCFTVEDSVGPGKRYEMAFQFECKVEGIFEFRWDLMILPINLTLPFTFLGTYTNPCVMLDRSFIDFGKAFIGRKLVSKVKIINLEDFSLEYAVDKSSCFSTSFLSHLTISPESGVILPKSHNDLEISYCHDKAINMNTSPLIYIKNKTAPLKLNTKAVIAEIECMVVMETETKQRIPLKENELNLFELNKFATGETIVYTFYITNKSNFLIEYKWVTKGEDIDDSCKIYPEFGNVTAFEETNSHLLLRFPDFGNNKKLMISLSIINGPTYKISLVLKSKVPGIHFSFFSHNFELCYIHPAGTTKKITELVLYNKEKSNLSLRLIREECDPFDVEFESELLSPEQEIIVPINFTPTKSGKFSKTITFEINGVHSKHVQLFGKAVDLKIETAELNDTTLNFGTIKVGAVKKKNVVLLNKTSQPVNLKLSLITARSTAFQRGLLEIKPSNMICMEAKKGRMPISLIFSPKNRVSEFTDEVLIEVEDIAFRAFYVTGKAIASDVVLNTSNIAFGKITLGCSVERKCQILNNGDIGVRFVWENTNSVLEISPINGFVKPGDNAPIDIVLKPNSVNNDIRIENIKCFLSDMTCLDMVVTGSCEAAIPFKDIELFVTSVRQLDRRQIPLINRSSQTMSIEPKIEGKYWSGGDHIIVEPYQTKLYDVIYQPLTMTTESNRHYGSIFFPLPDGTALYYTLQGISEPPKPTAKLSFETSSKLNLNESVKVENWLNVSQCFKIVIIHVRPEKVDQTFKVSGPSHINVGALETVNYDFSIYSYKEGAFNFKITFLNESSGEYIFYEVFVKCTKTNKFGPIAISSVVRQTVSVPIEIENPLNISVNLQVSTNISEISHPPVLTVGPRSSTSMAIDYQPVKSGEGILGKLELFCIELGHFIYEFILNAIPPKSESPINFSAYLGSNKVETAKLFNIAKQKCDYVLKTNNPDFHVEKILSAVPGGASGNLIPIDVLFEPSKIGLVEGILSVSSNIGGEYEFPLIGTCLTPKPQGPLLVKAGMTIYVPFKNPFHSTVSLNVQVDNTQFYVARPVETVKPRREIRIAVGFSGIDLAGKGGVSVSKLSIICAKSQAVEERIQWVYYLRGVSSDK